MADGTKLLESEDAANEKDESENGIRQRCDICKKTFARWSNLHRHVRVIHQVEACLLPGKLKCPLCNDLLPAYYDLQKHISDLHKLEIVIEHHAFKSEDAFQSWKKNEEKSTLSQFVQRNGIYVNNEGYRSVKYYCHRSGNYVSKTTPKRRRSLKKEGSNKVGFNCPARMFTAQYVEGCVEVEYVKTHVGHDQEVKRLPLTKEERQMVAEKMKQHVCWTDVLNDVRSSVSDQTWERIHFLTRKDINNIARDFNVSREGVPLLRVDDATSVDCWVKAMRNKSDNPVRFYKREGGPSPDHPELEVNDFLLVLMTDAQKETLAKHGEIVVVDNTRGAPPFEFGLVTVLTVDDDHGGVPCVFVFSNRHDEPTLRVAFKSVCDTLGTVRSKVFVSDDLECLFNAWQATFGFEGRRLLCDWHVRRTWKKQVSLIKGESNVKKDVLDKLWRILEHNDVAAFHCKLDELLLQLRQHDNTKEFGDYIYQQYAKRCEMWARCFRLDFAANINLSACIEKVRRILKYDHEDNKRVKRLDKSIQAAMHFHLNNEKLPSKLRELNRRHASSLSLSSDLVVSVDENNWKVVPVSKVGEPHKVQYTGPCPGDCDLHCTECRACYHDFTCTCEDRTVLKNMCVHVHLVCRAWNSSQEARSDESNDAADVLEAELQNPNDEAAEQHSSIEELRRNFVQEGQVLVEKHFANANSEQELQSRLQNLQEYFAKHDAENITNGETSAQNEKRPPGAVFVPQWDDWLSIVVVEQQ